MSHSAIRAGASLCLALTCLATPATPAAAQAPTVANPAVDSIFAPWDRPDSPGCALGVYRDGRIIYSRGYGLADLERRVPITPHTVFDIGSTSKQFTAASILLLAQDGKLSLDDDVRTHIPELPDYSTPITIRHLLHHTSGLRDYIGLLNVAGSRIDDVTTEDDALSIIARQKELNFTPGTEHLYSNSGYFLLSIIVQRASGQSLRDFARQRIFEPLGMTRTHFLGSYDDIVPDRALAYEPRGGGYRTDISRWLQLGDGAVFTTVEELLHWDANFYEPKVGGAALLTELQTTGTLADGKPLTYARGLIIGQHRGQRTVSHGGSWGGYRAELVRYPDQRLSVATLCNLASTNPSALARRVAEVYLGDVLTAAAATPPTPRAAVSSGPGVALPESALRGLVGAYRSGASREVRTVTLDGGKLFLTVGGGRYELAPRGEREFTVLGVPIQVTAAFDAPRAGAPRKLTVAVEGQGTTEFEQITLATPTAAELQEYTGSYFSEELQTTQRLVVTDGNLVVHRRSAPPQTLRPTTRDEFSAGSATLRFVRDGNGRVTGYLVDLGRIRNLRFERTAR